MRKKHSEHVNLERWLVSYADFITLLFAFFVVMYAISQADMAKFKKVSASIKAAFSAAGPVGMIDTNGSAGGLTVNPLEMQDIPGGRIENLPAGKTNTASEPDPDLSNLKEKLEESISLELGVSDISDKVQMLFDSRGLIVRLSAKDFFTSGSASVKEDLFPILDKIGRIVASTQRMIRVEGHTDSTEEKSAGFKDDWELSADRASTVVKYWIKRFGYDPKRIGVAGYSHYRPLSERTDEWGRAKNRRVEIIILNNSYE